MSVIRLFIVEDEASILKSQIKLLSGFKDIELVGAALCAEDAIGEINALKSLPHVVLCDLGLPCMSGIELSKYLKSLFKTIEILIFTVFNEENKVLEALKAGASGYLLKGSHTNKIHEAITEVFHGGTVIQPNLARSLLKYFSMPLVGLPEHIKLNHKTSLTLRELQCLQIIAKGLSNIEAAEVLKISAATIRTHLEHVYQKLEVSNRMEAVIEGIRQGIIEL